MKTSKIRKILKKCEGTDIYCRCFFSYDVNYRYFYILGCSDELIYGAEEDDFIIDGFHIRRIKDMDLAETKDDMCIEISRSIGVFRGINTPETDLSSWKSVFGTLKKLGMLVIIENEYTGKENFFYIGRITKVRKHSVIISWFDADGKWYHDKKIPYSDITTVIFNCRYSDEWEKYLTAHDMM